MAETLTGTTLEEHRAKMQEFTDAWRDSCKRQMEVALRIMAEHLGLEADFKIDWKGKD